MRRTKSRNGTKQGKQSATHVSQNDILPAPQDFFNLMQDNLSNFSQLALETFTSLQENIAAAQKELAEKSSTDIINASKNFIDKRFRHPDWNTHPFFAVIKQAYLLTSQITEHALQKVLSEQSATQQKSAQQFQYYIRFLLDALAPTNFAPTNPDVVQAMLNNAGENLIQGYQNWLTDISQGKNIFTPRMIDENAFEVGNSIAVTPGTVIYQNDVMQLLQYTPTTKTIYQRPLLIIPPWINKYYILDLQAHNSMVKWLVDQGYLVFMISWINPINEAQYKKQFSDYLQDGSLAALKIIKKIVPKQPVNVVGYCVGGALLACTQAYLSAKQDDSISSATYLTTLLDFTDAGMLGNLIDQNSLTLFETYMKEIGYLPGHVMAGIFNSLRANDLIWPAYIRHYLKGEPPPAFDLLYWNADATNIPATVHSFYLREMYLNNRLAKPGEIKLLNTALDLSSIETPIYFLAAKEDHIVPWTGAYKSFRLLNKKSKFVLSGSGHVAGVVNPATSEKYGFWACDNARPLQAQQWLTKATQHNGSWWQDWDIWLANLSGTKKTVKEIIKKSLPAIEPAPGSYVKQKII